MIKAYILIEVDPGMTKEVYDTLQRIGELEECHEVMGPYDIVAVAKTKNLSDIPTLLSSQIRQIPGVCRTTSLVTFPE